MKSFLLLLTILSSLGVNAQNGNYDSSNELRGNGQIVRETRTVQPFDAIDIHQFPAKITVNGGGTESLVRITVDDNLRPLLRVESEDGTLKLSFKDPCNRAFWISRANVDVSIITPALKRLKHGSNSDIVVRGLRGESFTLVNEANGSITLRGKVETIDIASLANGTINADELPVQTANIVTQANATVRVNAQQVHAVKQAFASIINVAEQADVSAMNRTASAKPVLKVVSIRFQNNSSQPRTVTLVSYAPGEEGNEANAFTLAPHTNRQKQYLVGTTI